MKTIINGVEYFYASHNVKDFTKLLENSVIFDFSKINVHTNVDLVILIEYYSI
jgi:hypothetical protein